MASYEEYINISKSRDTYWEVAFGLQEVDGLQPSEFLKELSKEHIEDGMSYDDIYHKVRQHYQTEKHSNRAMEADMVSVRIVEYLEQTEDYYRIVPGTLRGIHEFLFRDLPLPHDKRSGEFRDYDIRKAEPVLDGASILYTPWYQLKETLQWDFEQELRKDYSGLTSVETLLSVMRFIAGIWQIHPFPEGNTRTVSVLTILYLRSKGFVLDNTPFAKNAQYFRDALVLANTELPKFKTTKPLEEFFFQLISNEKSLKELPSLRKEK